MRKFRTVPIMLGWMGFAFVITELFLRAGAL